MMKGKITTNELYLLVLKTGENLLATIKDTDGEYIFCENLVAFMSDQQGKLITIPYLQFSEKDECEFNATDDIRHILTPNDTLKEYYKKTFSKSTIIMPDNKLMKPKLLP